jgi:hypothetical protein
MKLVEAILHTGGKTAAQIHSEAPELSDSEIQNILKINGALDGQKALVMPSPEGDEYWFVGLVNEKLGKEVCYLMEQDPEFGCFIDQREEFDRAYDDGDYAPDFIYTLTKDRVEITHELAKTKDEQEDSGQ